MERVIARHEILRTAFYRPSGIKVPFQVIADDAVPSWQEIDLRGLRAEQQTAIFEELFREEGRRPFDFEQSPFVHLSLLTLSARKHALLINLPALCADAWSLHNLVREISHYYGACFREAEPLGEPLQYVDYSEWQHELSETEDPAAEAGRAYWSQQPVSSLAGLKLPFESRPGEQSGFETESLTLRLEAELAAQITSLARQYESTPAAFLLACFQTLLWRLTGETRFLLGYLSDGRAHQMLHSALGLFAKWLPVAARFEENLTFSEVLWQVSESLREATERQEYFNWEEHAGLTEATIGFEFTEWPASKRAGGLCFTLFRQVSVIQRFKLQLACALAADGLQVSLHYDPACYEREEIERLAGYFAVLVGSAAQSPTSAISELEVLAERDRKQLLAEFNQTSADYPREQCLHQLFEQQVERTPAQVAVICAGRQLSYQELNAQANQLAHHLRRLGVNAGARVGLCVDRSLEMMVGLLGILKAGAAYVPLNPEYPRARLEQQLQEIEAPVLLTQAGRLEQLPEFAGEVLCLDRDAAAWSAEPQSNPEPVTKPEDAVYVIYTSGSTGMPKGVVIRHRSLVNYTHYMCQRLGLPADNGWQFATVSTITADLGNTCIYPSLVSGGGLHILSYEVATDGRQFAEYVAKHPIDVLKIVPSHLGALLGSQPTGAQVLPRKYLVLGGEALRYELVERIAEQGAECQVINHYGPTETTVGVLTEGVSLEGVRRWETATVPIGRPIANTEIYILDARQKPVPVGVAGELYIGGECLAEGYLKQPERTAERFIELRIAECGMRNEEGSLSQSAIRHPPSAITSGVRVYRTGDLARYLPDGRVEFLGRVDNQVKVRGYRIELEEVEVVIGQHTAVQQAVVVAREEEGGHKRLVAYVVGKSGQAPSVNELRDYLKERLPDYMVPSAYVMLGALPLTANGKVDRQRLPAPDQERAKAYLAPRTPTEELLAGIWAQVLGVKKVGIDDNFFSTLGGDSILSIQVIARANQAGLRLVPKQIFEHQTIAELAAVAGAAAAIQAEQGLVTGPLPLTPIQHWFFEQQFADPQHWNQAILLEVRQPLDPALLEKVVQRLLAHHDALRLRFVRNDSGWQQINADLDGATPFRQVNLSGLSEAEQKTAIEATAAEEQASLNLSAGPLLRIAYFDLGQQHSGRLLMVIHHLAVDGVSWRILLEDLQTGYQQLVRGEEIALPPKTTSFKQWAEKLAGYAQSEMLRGELSFWLAEPRQRVRRLPVDFPGGANTVASSRTVTVSLSPEETRAILQEVPETYHTQINDVLLTALALAYSRWTGARTVLIDLEGHGREEILEGTGLWRTVGWFTTHFPVLLDLGNTINPGAALKVIKEQLRAVPNRGIGYGLLRYLSQDKEVVERLAALPQPEVSFNYFGQFDQVLPESSPFGPASESCGPLHSPRGSRSYLLYLNGSVAGGQLRLTCLYSENLYRQTTIEGLTQGIAEALRSIIAHCQSAEAGGYTPSDFSLAKLDEEKLSQISSLLEELDDFEEEAS
jgi:amino acid adenylation domain-containing protein/non-ribosomal peptide synthase protein (TIGR01720 family)